jgi:hypothetical protein
VNNETAATVFRRLVAAQLLRRIADQLDLPDAQLRVERRPRSSWGRPCCGT